MKTWVTAAIATLMFVVAACGNPVSPREGAASVAPSVAQGFPIGILLPESKTSRYETFDRPLLTQRLQQLCPKCEILYQNAGQDSTAQQNQAEALVTGGGVRAAHRLPCSRPCMSVSPISTVSTSCSSTSTRSSSNVSSPCSAPIPAPPPLTATALSLPNSTGGLF